METKSSDIETDSMLELCLIPWSALTKSDVNPKHSLTAGKVANLLQTSKRYETLENFVSSLPTDVVNLFLEDETFRRALIHLRYKQERFEDVLNIIRSGRFSETSDLIEIWDEAQYHIWMKKHTDKGLTTLQRFRIRKRNPPPQSICPDGRRSRCLDENVRDLLLSWFKENIHAPYPNQRDREEIAQKTGLTDIQIRNWFSNARRRTNRREPQQASWKKTCRQKSQHNKDQKLPSPIIIPSVSDALTQSPASSRNASQAANNISSQPAGLQGLLRMHQQLSEEKSSALHPFPTLASSTQQSTDTTAFVSSMVHHSPTHSKEVLMHPACVTGASEHPVYATYVTEHSTPAIDGSEQTHATDAFEAVPEGIKLWSAPCCTTQPLVLGPTSCLRMPCPHGLQLPLHLVPYQQNGFAGNWRDLYISSGAPSSRSEPVFAQQMVSSYGSSWIGSVVPSAPEAMHFPCRFTGSACSSGVIFQNCPSSPYVEPPAAATRESPVQDFVTQQQRGTKGHGKNLTKLCFGSPNMTAILSTTTDIVGSSREPLFSPLLSTSIDSSQEPRLLDGSSPQQEAPFSAAETTEDVDSPYAGRGNYFNPDLDQQASAAAGPLAPALSSEAKSCNLGAEVALDHHKASEFAQPQVSETKRKQAEELAAHILLNMAAT